MNLNKMPIQEKILLLTSLLAKALNDSEYSLTIRWGEDKKAAIQEMESSIRNGKFLFLLGRIYMLEPERRKKIKQNFHESLDVELCKFPEIYMALEQEQPPKL